MCLKSVGILPGNTRDEQGRLRLNPVDPVDLMEAVYKNYSEWDVVSTIANGRTDFESILRNYFVILTFFMYAGSGLDG